MVSVRPVARTRPHMLSLEPQRLMSLEFDYSMMPFHCPERSRNSSRTTHLQALKGTGNEAYINLKLEHGPTGAGNPCSCLDSHI